MAALDTRWRKSRRSGLNGACVEVRLVGDVVQVRDSKDHRGPVLSFTPAEWAALVTAVNADDLS